MLIRCREDLPPDDSDGTVGCDLEVDRVAGAFRKLHRLLGNQELTRLVLVDHYVPREAGGSRQQGLAVARSDIR